MNIVVIGGGVSGVISAIYAARRGLNVTILERNNKLLKKLLMTGNGRCNYYNSDQNRLHYHSFNPEYINKIIDDASLDELKNFYRELGIIPRIKEGYYYPYSNQASSVRELLIFELNRLNVKVKCDYLVEDIKHDDLFIINNDIKADKVIISTGSKAYPKTGSDGMGYDFLKKLNHSITTIAPALVQIKANNKYLKELDGVRSDAHVSLYDKDKLLKEEIGELQFTDYGISGICTFNLSHLLKDGTKDKSVKINFIKGIESEIDRLKKTTINKTAVEVFEGAINYKIIRVILKMMGLDPDILWNDLTEKELFINTLSNFRLDLIGTNGFDRSQVCTGGLSLNDININTMESLKVKNLYIVGEILDLDGDCGGYNLTIAFITGYKAGTNI